MDVRINNLTSNVHMSDARAMLSPEVMEQIVKAVTAHIKQAEQEQKARQQDMRIEQRAAVLD